MLKTKKTMLKSKKLSTMAKKQKTSKNNYQHQKNKKYTGYPRKKLTYCGLIFLVRISIRFLVLSFVFISEVIFSIACITVV